ncbi:M50 family metallopeptidase [Candidatus Woesearchaeota archaeon]|nr:M50 family metallopeptidase [Candidatus Woesearchaeota archaeon]
MVYSLSQDYFPSLLPSLSFFNALLLGILATLLLFVSVFLHELAHALYAWHKGLKVESITLFFFGGLAHIEEEQLAPSTEIILALVGPLVSISLGLIFLIVQRVALSLPLWHLLGYIAEVNLLLGSFNLLPALPLDGGRIFYGLLRLKFPLQKSLRMATVLSKAIALLLATAGILDMFSILNLPASGLWLFLLGGFLYLLGETNEQHMTLQHALAHKTIGSLLPPMTRVDESTPLADVPDNATAILTTKKGKITGMVDVALLKRVRRRLLRIPPNHDTIGRLRIPLERLDHADITDDAMKTLNRLLRSSKPGIIIRQGKRIKGVITKEGVMRKV